jgi:hypothetical protein
MIPNEYGSIIDQYNNKYIIQLNTNNVIVIKEIHNDNFVKFFRKGELLFEFKDSKITDNRFSRTILDQKYTFFNGRLVSTEINNSVSNILIYQLYEDTDALLINPLYLSIFMIIFSIILIIALFEFIYSDLGLITSFIPGITLYNKKGNIIKLRRTSKRNA